MKPEVNWDGVAELEKDYDRDLEISACCRFGDDDEPWQHITTWRSRNQYEVDGACIPGYNANAVLWFSLRDDYEDCETAFDPRAVWRWTPMPWCDRCDELYLRGRGSGGCDACWTTSQTATWEEATRRDNAPEPA